MGGIDALVQLHGDASSRQIDELSDSDWHDTLHTNLVVPFPFKNCYENMNENSHGGRIVLTSTASAKHGGGSDTIP